MYGLTLPPSIGSAEDWAATFAKSRSRLFRARRLAYTESRKFASISDPCGRVPHPSFADLRQIEALQLFSTGRYGGGRRDRVRARRAYKNFYKNYDGFFERRAKMCPSTVPSPTPLGNYGIIGTSIVAYNKMVPKDPQLSIEQDPPRLCLDLKSEQALQNQRKFATFIGGPAVFLAGKQIKGFFGTFVMGLGIACTAWHYTSYKKVSEITGIK